MGVKATRSGVVCAAFLLIGLIGCASPAVRVVPEINTTGHAAATPRDRAEADAAQIVGSFVPPEGATRLARPAGATARALAQPPSVPADPDVAYDHDFWVVSGEPQAVLTKEADLVPSRFTAMGGGSSGGPGTPTVEFDSYSLPPVAGVLTARTLDISVAATSAGQTVIRVDAIVTWIAAKPAAERIPASAVSVTITGYPGLDPAPGEKTRSAVVTAGVTVRKIATLVDGLPLAPAGALSCPADTGRSLRLVFRSVHGAELAVLVVPVSGCQFVSVTIGGVPLPGLDGQGFANEVLSSASLHWPSY
jgi:hypothetical protein